MPQATATWPIDKKPNDFKEMTVKEKMKSDFEAGYVQSRPKFTRPRKKFQLVWDDSPHNPLTDDDKETLDQFFQDHGSETIYFPHPFKNGAIYNVLFEDPELEFELSYYKEGRFGEERSYWSLTVNLIEQ